MVLERGEKVQTDIAADSQTPLAREADIGTIFSHASLAQLAEHLTLNQRVVGSSPTGGTFASIRLLSAACCGAVSHKFTTSAEKS